MTAQRVVLGIESTAHTFGVAVLRGREVLSNVRKPYTTAKGGMIPAKVAEHHEEAVLPALREALALAAKRGCKLGDVRLVAYSAAPGLGQALRIGAAAAKTLALRLDAPLVPVNHCIAHLEVAALTTKATDPILLYASGANTQVIAYDAGRYRVFGETLDTGVGNFLDTLARHLGLGFPGGPAIERLAIAAANGRTPRLIPLPYAVKGMDVSFAGLETHLARIVGAHDPRDIAFSAQEHVFAMLVEVAERAMAHVGKDELALGGGVACNARLREMCAAMCKARGARFFCPAAEFLVDNAAMIAWAGLLMHERGGVSVRIRDAGIDPYERTDDVDVAWR